ncbi:hypothetical protein [Lonepinella sp. MS14436]|uniref:hypothetical protein n=1 Tax=Lonepinella sp. MS14436 TaxID=3003619 RepID=UPI0036D8289E
MAYRRVGYNKISIRPDGYRIAGCLVCRILVSPTMGWYSGHYHHSGNKNLVEYNQQPSRHGGGTTSNAGTGSVSGFCVVDKKGEIAGQRIW